MRTSKFYHVLLDRCLTTTFQLTYDSNNADYAAPHVAAGADTGPLPVHHIPANM